MEIKVHEVRKRAVRLWRHYEASYGTDAKKHAIDDCESRIKKAYTSSYRSFWEAVKDVLVKCAP